MHLLLLFGLGALQGALLVFMLIAKYTSDPERGGAGVR
jgi:hypothetical protein